MGALRTGRGQDAGTDVGPLINADAVESVGQLVTDAVHDGAEVVCRRLGARRARATSTRRPCCSACPREARINSEEIFGPVAPITTFTSDDEAIALANATEYGLASYVYTRDLARTIKVAEALEFGMVGVNTGLVSNPAAPFGGVKASGFGREGGFEGIEEYLDTTYVAIPGSTGRSVRRGDGAPQRAVKRAARERLTVVSGSGGAGPARRRGRGAR